MKKTTIASLMATAIVLPQLASGAILIAGWHSFIPATDPPGTPAFSSANEGMGPIIGAATTFISYTSATNTGGSTDGWYGPDNTPLGGVRTEQPFVAPAPGYTAETTNPAGPRLQPGFNGTDTAFAPVTGNFDGRIASTNGVDIRISNPVGSGINLDLQSFVFDAFLGDVSDLNATAQFGQFVITISGVNPSSNFILPSYGVTGYNSTGAQAGFALNTPFGPSSPTSISVPNAIDFGTGTNYVDFVVNLSGLTLNPGQSIKIGFNQTGTGTVRLDNLALFAVPEPSSVMTLAALVGSGCFFRRRKLA